MYNSNYKTITTKITTTYINKNKSFNVIEPLICRVKQPTISSRYANIFVFIDCENNQFLKK